MKTNVDKCDEWYPWLHFGEWLLNVTPHFPTEEALEACLNARHVNDLNNLKKSAIDAILYCIPCIGGTTRNIGVIIKDDVLGRLDKRSNKAPIFGHEENTDDMYKFRENVNSAVYFIHPELFSDAFRTPEKIRTRYVRNDAFTTASLNMPTIGERIRRVDTKYPWVNLELYIKTYSDREVTMDEILEARHFTFRGNYSDIHKVRDDIYKILHGLDEILSIQSAMTVNLAMHNFEIPTKPEQIYQTYILLLQKAGHDEKSN